MSVQTITLTESAVAGIAPTLVSDSFATATERTVKTGRIRPISRPQCLRLSTYLGATGAAPPQTVDYAAKANASISRMYLNDQYGDCVIAGKYHAEGVWSANESGTAVVGTDQEVLNAYHTICGPGDNGCNIDAVLNYFRDKGLKFNGVVKKIDGYVSIDWTNKLEVQVAIFLFGALSLGINLPNAWTSNAIWDVTNSSIVGGHDVTAVGYNDKGVQISSWGAIYTITWAAFTSTRWLEEAYAIMAPDWYNNDKISPSGVDAQTLKDDLAKLGGGTIPPLPDPPAPPSPPPPAPSPPVPPKPPGPPTPLVISPNYTGTLTGSMTDVSGRHRPIDATVSLKPDAQSLVGFPVYEGTFTGTIVDALNRRQPITGKITLKPSS